MQTLNERLRYAREVADLTQEQVAAAFDIRRESVAEWESGKSKPGSARFPTLVTLYGATYGWLMEGRGEPPRSSKFGNKDQVLKVVPIRSAKGEVVKSGRTGESAVMERIDKKLGRLIELLEKRGK